MIMATIGAIKAKGRHLRPLSAPFCLLSSSTVTKISHFLVKHIRLVFGSFYLDSRTMWKVRTHTNTLFDWSSIRKWLTIMQN